MYKVQSPVKDKLETLYALLGELRGESALVFCNLREAVERVSHYLTERGVDNEAFHGGMEQPERERALSKSGTVVLRCLFLLTWPPVGWIFRRFSM